MKFIADKNMYTTTLYPVLGYRRAGIKVKLDTGSPVTVLDQESISSLIPSIAECEQELKSAFSRQPSKYKGVGGAIVNLYPIRLKEILFDGTVLKDFLCFVYEKDGNNLIGYDFISACDVDKSNAGEYIELSNIDVNKNRQNFIREYANRSGRRVSSIDEIFSGSHTQQSNDPISSLLEIAGLAGKV